MYKKILLILLIVLISIIGIREFFIDYEPNILEFSISNDEILNLINKGAEYNNYYRTVTTNEGKEEYYYKDKKLTCFVNSKLKYWMNLNENEKEMILIEDEENKIAKKVKDFEQINFPTEKTQNGYFCWIYFESDFECEGITTYNNRPTIIVKVEKEKGKFNTTSVKYYIDKETGVIVKRIEKEKNLFITTSISEFDRGLIFDSVTDADIQKPNLDEFEILTCDFPGIAIW